MSQSTSPLQQPGAFIWEKAQQAAYHGDEATFGAASKWAAQQVCRLVSHFSSNERKNAPFTGSIRTVTLATATILGQKNLKKPSELRYGNFFKWLETIQNSTMLVARTLYGEIAQNYHAEDGVAQAVKQITELAQKDCKSISSSTRPDTVFGERLSSLFSSKVKEKPITVAEAGRHFGKIVLPTVIGATLRFSTAYIISTFIFDGRYARFTTALAANALGLSLLARGTTERLSKYKPPSSPQGLSQLVTSNTSMILSELDDTIEPTAREREDFERHLQREKFESFPFEAFTEVRFRAQEKSSTKSRDRSPSPTLDLFSKGSSRKSSRYKSRPRDESPHIREHKSRSSSHYSSGSSSDEDAREFPTFHRSKTSKRSVSPPRSSRRSSRAAPWAQAQKAREAYEKKYPDSFRLSKKYWELFIEEQAIKANYYEERKEYDKELMASGAKFLAIAYINGSTNYMIVPESRFHDNAKFCSDKFRETCCVKGKDVILERFQDHTTLANKVYKSIRYAKYPEVE